MRHKERINIALLCRDCDYIPKVEGSGKIYNGSKGEYQLMHNGVKVFKDCYHEFITKIIHGLNGHHEPQEEKLFFEILKHIEPGSTMLELGSFWSYYSLWFKKEVSGATNYMIEPNSQKMKVGIQNFELNGYDSNNFIEGCIGNKHQKKVLFKDWDNTKYEMPMWSIDYFMEHYGLYKLGVLHSDVQGAENDMLKGAHLSFGSKKIDHVFISTHGDKIHQDCIYFLENYNYNIICSHTVEESFSGDGLIVASCILTKNDIDCNITLNKIEQSEKKMPVPNKLKKFGKKIVSSLNFKNKNLLDSYSQYGQDAYCFNKYFSNQETGTFLEIGADDGIDKSNTFFYEKKGWKGLCVEPSPKRFELLRINRNCVCENYAISEEEGEMEFMDISGWGKGLSGLVNEYEETHKKRIEGELKNPGNKGHEVVLVNTVPLSKVLNKHLFSHIDFCSIDVEGGELSVIKSIDFNQCTFGVMIIENNYGDNSVELYLNSVGYIKKESLKIDDLYIPR